MKARHVVLIDVVGLSLDHLKWLDATPNLQRVLGSGRLTAMDPVFPAVTLPVQASLTTGVLPSVHGVVANGFYFPESFQVSFWEQPAALVQAPRIWDTLKAADPGFTSALLFFQSSLYAGCDVVITPKPLHTDSGMIPWCYSKPVGFYESLAAEQGPFNLMDFWGPMAGIGGSRWIARAAATTLKRLRPNLTLVYLPHLDYALQKLGPNDPAIAAEVAQVDAQVGVILDGLEQAGMIQDTLILVVSEYAFQAVSGAIALNRLLREQGLLAVRTIQGREYLDLELSPAFAMVDHQIAHLYVKPGQRAAVRRLLEQTQGIDRIIEGDQRKSFNIDHPRSGDLIAVSARDRWFSYYWWSDPEREPDFAGTVDIHRKPGYDPLELFLVPGTRRISQDTALIKGSHGTPPVAARDRVPLIASGAGLDALPCPEQPRVTDIPALITAALTG